MSKQKGKQVQSEIGDRVLNILSSLFATASIAFSERYNAQYGILEFVTILSQMARFRISSEEAVRQIDINKKRPTAKWFRDMIHSITSNDAMMLCDEMLNHTIKHIYKKYRNKSVLVAIDKHLIPRHDKFNMKYLIRSKAGGGTHKFESYSTLQIVDGPANAVLCCMRELKESIDANFVRRFTQILKENKIRARLILLDREFYSVDVMEAVLQSKNKFLMPAIKNSTTKKAILEYHAGTRDMASKHTITNKFQRSMSFTLIITKSKKHGDLKANITEWYHAFATNLTMGRALKEITTLPEEYRKRWGIETGYRQIEEIRPRTTSRDDVFRMMLFYTALLFYNLWTAERQEYTSYGILTLKLMASLSAMIGIGKLIEFPYDPGGYG